MRESELTQNKPTESRYGISCSPVCDIKKNGTTNSRINEFKVLHNIFGGLYSEQGKLKMFFEVVNDKLYTNFKGV